MATMSETRKSKRASRVSRSRQKADVVLDEGLAAVREGREPHINGEVEHLGTLKVLDPHEPDSKSPRTKIVNLRDDPVGQLHKRGQLSDNGGNADIRLKAARRYQREYEKAEIGGARGIDMTKDVVDGGRFEMADTDSRLAAQATLNKLRRKMGILAMPTTEGAEVRILGSRLLAWVLGDKLPLCAVAERLGYDRRRLPMLRHFTTCLDIVAIEFGISDNPQRKRGPKHVHDRFHDEAQFADSPALHRATRLATAMQ